MLVMQRISEMPNVSRINIKKTKTKKGTLLQQYSVGKLLFHGYYFFFPEEPFAEELQLQNALSLALSRAQEREKE